MAVMFSKMFNKTNQLGEWHAQKDIIDRFNDRIFHGVCSHTF